MKELVEEKATIEQEINDIETQLKKLKSKLEAEQKQPTTGQ
jgi:ribosome-associated translation inhibitor RaiA